MLISHSLLTWCLLPRAQRELAGALAGHADAELAAARAEAAVALQRLAALEQRVEASSARALAELEAMRAQTVSALGAHVFRVFIGV